VVGGLWSKSGPGPKSSNEKVRARSCSLASSSPPKSGGLGLGQRDDRGSFDRGLRKKANIGGHDRKEDGRAAGAQQQQQQQQPKKQSLAASEVQVKKEA
jgi:hypothetical protein